MPAANLHLTLAFLGEADQLTTTRLMAAVERQHCPPLTIALNETGWFVRQGRLGRPDGVAQRAHRAGQGAASPRREAGAWQRRAGLSPPRHPVAQGERTATALPAPDFVLQADRFCLYQSSRPRTGCATSPRLLAAAGQRENGILTGGHAQTHRLREPYHDLRSPAIRAADLRYKRFLTDVQLDNGEVITIHCANTGAMTGCAEPGTRVWYSTSDNPKRKLPHSWEIAESP